LPILALSHGTVVSVRLDAAEAERLRKVATELQLNMSQVLRRALANFDPEAHLQDQVRSTLRAYVRAFTFGGTSFVGRVHVHPEGEERSLEFPESTTVDARVRERIPA
jgi:predicted transcriptional regulator